MSPCRAYERLHRDRVESLQGRLLHQVLPPILIRVVIIVFRRANTKIRRLIIAILILVPAVPVFLVLSLLIFVIAFRGVGWGRMPIAFSWIVICLIACLVALGFACSLEAIDWSILCEDSAGPKVFALFPGYLEPVASARPSTLRLSRSRQELMRKVCRRGIIHSGGE
jgi:hypothetical protein